MLGIVADAGTGKSRLCYEFAEYCRAQGVTIMEGGCVAHGKNLPLLPVLEVIRGYFGIEDGDSDRVVREKIAGRLLLLDDIYRDELPLLFDFLGAPDPDRPSPALPPEARQRRLFAVLRRLTQSGGVSGQEVGLVWFEDLHWIDPASEEPQMNTDNTPFAPRMPLPSGRLEGHPRLRKSRGPSRRGRSEAPAPQAERNRDAPSWVAGASPRHVHLWF